MIRRYFTEFRVGIFVATGLILAMVVIFMVGGEYRIFERQYTFSAAFDSISGLRVGAPVQLAGLKVGFVNDIRFPKDVTLSQITVVMQIRTKFRERIRKDSTATIETQGLLGDKYIYITLGSQLSEVLKEGEFIEAKETTSIFALADKAGAIMDDIGKAAQVVNEMLSSVKGTKGEGDLKASIASLRKMLEQVEKGGGLLHAILFDPKGAQVISDLSDTMHSVRDIASGAEAGSKAHVGGLVSNLKAASADLRSILASMKRGEGTLGRLMSDPALYDDMRAFLGRANRNLLLKAVIRSTITNNEKQEGGE